MCFVSQGQAEVEAHHYSSMNTNWYEEACKMRIPEIAQIFNGMRFKDDLSQDTHGVFFYQIIFLLRALRYKF